MCMSEGCCAAAMGRWERSRVRAHVEFTEVGYIQLLLLMCATICYHFRVVPLRDDKGVLRQPVIVSVSKARCKMRLSLLCMLSEVRPVGCGFGNGGATYCS